MDTILNLEPEELKIGSIELYKNGDRLITLSSKMTKIINETVFVWEGDTATAYKNKFRCLDDNLQRVIERVKHYAVDLEKLADQYETSRE